MHPQSSIEWIFTGKNWLYWDLVTLFSLPEVFCGPQICQRCVGGRGSAPDHAGGAHDALHLFPNPHPSAPSFCGPSVKSWPRPWRGREKGNRGKGKESCPHRSFQKSAPMRSRLHLKRIVYVLVDVLGPVLDSRRTWHNSGLQVQQCDFCSADNYCFRSRSLMRQYCLTVHWFKVRPITD